MRPRKCPVPTTSGSRRRTDGSRAESRCRPVDRVMTRILRLLNLRRSEVSRLCLAAFVFFLVAVDDVGNVINPMIVDGMVHGGVVQGIGQALQEEAIYSEDGQLLTGSMADYAVPAAADVPFIETNRTVTPTNVNPMGLKGASETGTIAASPAIINAVVDALSPLGVRHIDMPAKAEKVWRLIQAARS